MKESDLYNPVKRFLIEKGCTDVYGEVGTCDVLALQGDTNWIVELKTTLSFKLIDQAIDRTRIGHFVYIAIPKRKSGIPRCVKEILSNHHIGLLEVGKRSVKETIPATYNSLADNRKAFQRIRKLIRTYNVTQIGGVKSGESVTDYSITMDKVKEFLSEHHETWFTADMILESCETHYKNPKRSLTATLQEKWNQEWVETTVINRRRYFRSKLKKTLSEEALS